MPADFPAAAATLLLSRPQVWFQGLRSEPRWVQTVFSRGLSTTFYHIVLHRYFEMLPWYVFEGSFCLPRQVCRVYCGGSVFWYVYPGFLAASLSKTGCNCFLTGLIVELGFLWQTSDFFFIIINFSIFLLCGPCEQSKSRREFISGLYSPVLSYAKC